MATQNKFDITKLTLPLMGAIVLFAVIYFLISKTDGTNGFDALKMQNASFWIWAVLGVAAAVVVGYFAKQAADHGDKTGKVIGLFILAVLLLTLPFGKACSSKADPVTSPNYQSAP